MWLALGTWGKREVMKLVDDVRAKALGQGVALAPGRGGQCVLNANTPRSRTGLEISLWVCLCGII